MLDVVVVGSGPNGLAAAITVAREGRSVVVLEGTDEVGGACRSADLTGTGAVHDVGSAIHPLAVASPFMQSVPWHDHGLRWVHPPAAVAHPLDDGGAAVAWTDLERTAAGLDDDGDAYRSLMTPLVDRFDEVVGLLLGTPASLLATGLQHPLFASKLGTMLAQPATMAARRFAGNEARALFAGHAAHSVVPLNKPFTAGFGLLLGASAHAVGWPFPAGGAGEITRVMAEVLMAEGGEIRTGHRVDDLADLPSSRAVIFALTPRQIEAIAERRLSRLGQRAMRRYRYGPGACKIDLVTDRPVPWTNPAVAEAGTVHLGGTLEQVAEAEATVGRGEHAQRPFVLLAQHSLFDDSRAPDGLHTVWAYCHVPHGSNQDVSGVIKAQIERFAPGFIETIVAEKVSPPSALEAMNPNLVGGDVAGGSNRGLRTVFRPRVSFHPHRIEVPSFFIGSAGAAPGGGVHGMSGHHAATEALEYLQ